MGEWNIQYILSSRNSRINGIAPDQSGTFDSSKPAHHERGILKINVEDVNGDGYVLNGTIVADNDNLCTGVDPCDGEDKLYKDHIKLDDCEVCIFDEDLHVLAIDDNGICDDTNGGLHELCPEGRQLDECGICRDKPETNDDGEIEYPEDWNQSCNDCAGNANGDHVITACGDCTTDTNLQLDGDNYCENTNSPNYGECPEGHTDDCGTCHATAPTEDTSVSIRIYARDSWGDGWDGNSVNIENQNGEVINNITVPSGGDNWSAFDVVVESDYQFIFVGGEHPTECRMFIVEQSSAAKYDASHLGQSTNIPSQGGDVLYAVSSFAGLGGQTIVASELGIPTPAEEITIYPSGWNAECSVCNDPAANNYAEGSVTDESKCTYTICGTNTADNYEKTNSVANGDFAAPVVGATTINDPTVCVYFGCANQYADNYSNGTYHELNTTSSEACEFTYCDDENACNYISLADKQSAVNTQEGTFNTGGCIDTTSFGISTKSYIKENNVDYEVTLSESNFIGHEKVEITVDGNLLQSGWANIGEVKDVANQKALLVYPIANNFDTEFNELYKNESSLELEVDFTDEKLYMPIVLDEDDKPLSYKSPALISAEEANSEKQTIFDEKEQAHDDAVADEASKQTEIADAEEALGVDSDQLTNNTLWGDYNAAQAVVTTNGAAASQEQIDARDVALDDKNSAVTALGTSSDAEAADGSLYAQLAALTTAVNIAYNELETAQTFLTSSEAFVTQEQNELEVSIASGRVPIDITMTWHKDQEDALLLGNKFINTYNLEIELANDSDKEYFETTHVLMSLQDNNFIAHLGEIRNGNEMIARTNMSGFSSQNSRLANGMSFGDCSVDAIRLKLVSGDLEKELVLLKNSPVELDLQNDDVLKQLNSLDEIVITATAIKWENYAPKEVLSFEKTVTLHKLGCTDTNYNSYHESNTMPFTYDVTSTINGSDVTETVSSCRNAGCLDEFADTYDPTADHADLSMCEYSVTNNIDDVDNCNYDSNATLLTDSSEYARYKHYCEDESSALCQLWLESNDDMLPAQKEALDINMTVNSEGQKTVLIEDDNGDKYILIYVQATNNYLALLNEPEYDLEETADLLELEEKYIESMHANNKLTKLNQIINDSVNATANGVAEIIDHAASVGRALASIKEAAKVEYDAAQIVYDDLKAVFLAKYTDDELETYDTNITEGKVDIYLVAKLQRNIDKRIIELSCSGGVPYLVLTARTQDNIPGGDIIISEIGSITNDKIEIKLENAEEINDNVLTFKVGPLPNRAGVYNSVIMTPVEYLQANSDSRSAVVSRSTIDNDNSFEIGDPECNDTNANNYDEAALNAVDEDGFATAYGTLRACEYHYCDKADADNYDVKESLANDGTEGTNVANDDACAYYYCNDEKACNYYSDDLTLLYNTDGLALTSTQAQQAIAV